MHLTLNPPRGLPGQPETTIHVAGDTLTLDGVAYDLSAVTEGGEGWLEDGDGNPIVGPITRHGGVIHAQLTVLLGDSAAPVQAGPWIIEDAQGDVVIPAARLPQQEDAA